MKTLITKYFGIRKKNQKGFTLLEYCAGAAVLLGIVVAGMSAFGDGIADYMEGLGNWVRTQEANPAIGRQ